MHPVGTRRRHVGMFRRQWVGYYYNARGFRREFLGWTEEGAWRRGERSWRRAQRKAAR